MQHELNDYVGAKELARYRLQVAREDLAAAELIRLVEQWFVEKNV